MAPPPSAPLAYYWGDDAWSIRHAPEALAARLAGDGPPLDLMRLSGAATTAEEITERVATAPLFGGGTLVVVADPAPLLKAKPADDRREVEPEAAADGPPNPMPAAERPLSARSAADRLLAVLAAVAEGNGLAFLEYVDGSAKSEASLLKLRNAVGAAGGEVRQFKSPTQLDMARWIRDRATDRGIEIEPAAAALLAERIGAYIREGDVDRRRQGELAMAELEKLSIYRLDARIRPEDVEALVAEAVPGSVWAFQDAIGRRSAGEASDLADRLDLPGPLLVAVLHRRLRELLEVADLLASGTTEPELVRILELHPYRVQQLVRQSRTWTMPELENALTGLLELDAALKSKEGGGEVRRRAAISLWIAGKVRRPSRS